MKHRLVALVAAVALLVQGTAMAWTPHAPATADEVAAIEPMPCHGDAAKTPAADPCDCCDAGCPFACGGAPMPAAIAAAAVNPPDHEFVPAPILAPLSSHSLSPFRPPAA